MQEWQAPTPRQKKRRAAFWPPAATDHRRSGCRKKAPGRGRPGARRVEHRGSARWSGVGDKHPWARRFGGLRGGTSRLTTFLYAPHARRFDSFAQTFEILSITVTKLSREGYRGKRGRLPGTVPSVDNAPPRRRPPRASPPPANISGPRASDLQGHGHPKYRYRPFLKQSQLV